MKKTLLSILILAGLTLAKNPSWGQWLPVNGSVPVSQITATGAYYTTSNDRLSNYAINARGSSATDTMTAYIADANGKIGTDLCTWIGTAAGYVQAGGNDAHLDFKGAWQLIVTKCVGSFTATVDQ